MFYNCLGLCLFLERVEEKLKNHNRDLSMVRDFFISSIINIFTFVCKNYMILPYLVWVDSVLINNGCLAHDSVEMINKNHWLQLSFKHLQKINLKFLYFVCLDSLNFCNPSFKNIVTVYNSISHEIPLCDEYPLLFHSFPVV